jgi:hypothetical protein
LVHCADKERMWERKAWIGTKSREKIAWRSWSSRQEWTIYPLLIRKYGRSCGAIWKDQWCSSHRLVKTSLNTTLSNESNRRKLVDDEC